MRNGTFKNICLSVFIFSLVSCVNSNQKNKLSTFKINLFLNVFSTFDYVLESRASIALDGQVLGIGLNILPLVRFKTILNGKARIICLSYKLPHITKERELFGRVKFYEILKKEQCVDRFSDKALGEIYGVTSLRIILERDKVSQFEKNMIQANVLFLDISLKGGREAFQIEIPLMNVIHKKSYKRYSTGESNRINSGVLYLPKLF